MDDRDSATSDMSHTNDQLTETGRVPTCLQCTAGKWAVCKPFDIISIIKCGILSFCLTS